MCAFRSVNWSRFGIVEMIEDNGDVLKSSKSWHMLSSLCCPTPGNPNIGYIGQQLLSLFNTWSVCWANWQVYFLFESLPLSECNLLALCKQKHNLTCNSFEIACKYLQYLLWFPAFNSMFVTISKSWLSSAAAFKREFSQSTVTLHECFWS